MLSSVLNSPVLLRCRGRKIGVGCSRLDCRLDGDCTRYTCSPLPPNNLAPSKTSHSESTTAPSGFDAPHDLAPPPYTCSYYPCRLLSANRLSMCLWCLKCRPKIELVSQFARMRAHCSPKSALGLLSIMVSGHRLLLWLSFGTLTSLSMRGHPPVLSHHFQNHHYLPLNQSSSTAACYS